jgi:methylated-DNA-[protein]-cysteine S-methyltransferase
VGLNAEYKHKDSIIIKETQTQLDAYFKGKLFEFDIPLLLIGSDFQKTVWNELLKIPFGNTETYLSLSRKIGNEKAIRAVAAANGANSISIIVPCHRILGSDGDLVGYGGGLQVKKKLLQLENAQIDPQLSIF